MKRTYLACLTVILAFAAMAFVFTRGYAQTGSPAQWSAAYTSGPLSSCPAPEAGKIMQCSVTNVGLEQSVDGSAYVPVNQPGPVQSFGTLACPATGKTLYAGGVVFRVVLGPGCKESNP